MCLRGQIQAKKVSSLTLHRRLELFQELTRSYDIMKVIIFMTNIIILYGYRYWLADPVSGSIVVIVSTRQVSYKIMSRHFV